MNELDTQDDTEVPNRLPTTGRHSQRAYRKYVAVTSTILGICCFIMAIFNIATGDTISGLIAGLISIALLKLVWTIRNREDWWGSLGPETTDID